MIKSIVAIAVLTTLFNSIPKVQAEPKTVHSLGEFTLTAYCSCSRCCGKWANNRPQDEYGNELVIGASGELLTAGYSIAVDPDVIPYGTIVIINGQEYKAQDTGVKGNEIDIYFITHKETVDFGIQAAEIFIKEEK